MLTLGSKLAVVEGGGVDGDEAADECEQVHVTASELSQSTMKYLKNHQFPTL